MISDCLAPVLTERGIATIVTADGMSAYGDDGKFHKIAVESYDYQGVLFRVHVQRDYGAGIWLTPDATLYSATEGWVSVQQFADDYREDLAQSRRMVMGFWVKCLVCGKWYFPNRPLRSTCSGDCMRKAVESSTMTAQPISASNVDRVLRHDWVAVTRMRALRLKSKVDAVRFTSVEGQSGVWVSSVLLSSTTLNKPNTIKE